LQTVGVIEQTQRCIRFPALHLEAPHDINALWGKTQMAHHRNLAIDQRTYHLDTFVPALELHRGCTSLQESAGIAYGFLDAEVKAEKRHIGDEQSTRLGACNSLQVMVHHRHADGQRVFKSETNIADTVTDEDDIDHGIRDTCRNRVVGGAHDEAPPLLLPPLQDGNRNALNRLLRNVAHFRYPSVDDLSSILQSEAARL
jgi:hypothetical protein